MRILRIISFYFITAVLSLLFGGLMGWHFKIPTAKLWLNTSQITAEWRKDAYLEGMKAAVPYFDTKYFQMNWPVAGLAFLTFALLALFLFDQRFRKFIYVRFLFIDQRQIFSQPTIPMQVQKAPGNPAIDYSERSRLEKMEVDKSFEAFADSLKIKD